MTNVLEPSMLKIRSYQVGFGDCFLLTFHYPESLKVDDVTDNARHVLIDFGTTGLPDNAPKDQMLRVANDIALQCGGEKGKLHVVVATHRHKDHISGFSTDGYDTGTVIKKLNPEVVIQPWTEDPDAKRDATKLQGLATMQAFASDPQVAFIAALHDMNVVAGVIGSQVEYLNDKRRFSQGLTPEISEQITFLAKDNDLPNASAVKNLSEMGKKHYYVNHGYKLGIQRLLPGVKVHVLGPPNIEQYEKVKKQRSADKDEFWMLMAAAKGFWGLQAATAELTNDFIAGTNSLFPKAGSFRGKTIPPHNRWFVRQMRSVRGDQLLGIVRILDKALNNTSVILLFEVAGKKFLFSGDAQIENWEYALGNEDDVKLLKGVDLYKVGHHGSRNATPRSLWNHFAKKSENKGDANRLATVMSTMKGKHGHDEMKTEVPRTTLVEQLLKYSDYHSTHELRDDDLYKEIVVKF